MSGRAFLLEQDPTLKGLIETLLERQGFSVTAPPSIQEALKMDHGSYDVFVVDLTHDGGYEVLRHLRSCCDESMNCIALITPGSHTEVVRQLGSDRPFRILEKPFELNEFADALRGYVRRNKRNAVRVQCLSCEQEKAYPVQSDELARALAREEGWRVVTFVRQDQAAPGKSEFITVCPECTAAVAT